MRFNSGGVNQASESKRPTRTLLALGDNIIIACTILCNCPAPTNEPKLDPHTTKSEEPLVLGYLLERRLYILFEASFSTKTAGGIDATT